jgi:hypothetical protein
VLSHAAAAALGLVLMGMGAQLIYAGVYTTDWFLAANLAGAGLLMLFSGGSVFYALWEGMVY